jgi:hypothetical protein
MEMNMSITTNSLVARAKKLAVPAGILATLLFVFAFFVDHNKAMAAPRRAAGRLERVGWWRSTTRSKQLRRALRLPWSMSPSPRASRPTSKE